MIKVTKKTTVRELIQDLRDRPKDCTSVSIHYRKEGDKLPKGLAIFVTDNPSVIEELEKIHAAF